MEKELMTSIIAAGSAIFAVAASQLGGIFRSVFDRNSERTVLLRLKLEELADSVHQTTEWSNCLMNALYRRGGTPTTSGEGRVSLQVSTHARRVYVLSLLYFPSFLPDAINLLDASYDFYLTLTNAQVDQDQVADATSKFRLARAALDNLVTAEAKKIT